MQPYEISFFSFSIIPLRSSKLFCVSSYFWVVYSVVQDVPRFIHPMKDISVVSSYPLLLIKLLWTFSDKFLWGYKFPFLWNKCPSVYLMGWMVSVYLVLQETANCFHSGSTILHPHQQHVRDEVFLILLSSMCC